MSSSKLTAMVMLTSVGRVPRAVWRSNVGREYSCLAVQRVRHRYGVFINVNVGLFVGRRLWRYLASFI